jgi:hypothetical protein
LLEDLCSINDSLRKSGTAFSGRINSHFQRICAAFSGTLVAAFLVNELSFKASVQSEPHPAVQGMFEVIEEVRAS